MKEKNKYLVKNTLIFGISSFGSKILSFLMVPLYTSVLTTAEYGTIDIINTTAILVAYVFSINIYGGVLRFAIDKKGNDRLAILKFGLKILAIGSTILLFLTLIVKYLLLNKWDNNYYFIFYYFIFSTLYQILSSYLRADNKIKEVAIAGVINTIVLIACNLIFLLLVKLGITGYLLSSILAPFIACLYEGVRIKASWKTLFESKIDRHTKENIIKYCIPLVFNNLALWINAYLDRYYVTMMCGIDQNGVYSIANKIPTILATCYSIFSDAWTLSAIKDFDKEDKDGFFIGTYNSYSAFIVFTCSILIILNVPLAKVLYSRDFFEAWKYSSILLLSTMFNALTIFLGSIFSAIKRTSTIAYTTIVSALVNIILNVLLIPIFGALGAAIATVVAYVVIWAMRLKIVRKYITLRVNLIRDIVAYCLLGVQVFLEHYYANHFYIGQILILLILLYLYKNHIVAIISIFNQKLKMK